MAKTKLRPETKQKILAAWAEEFRGAGLPTVEEAREQMLALLKQPDEHSTAEFVESGLAVGHSWTPLAMIEHEIDQWDEPTPEELEASLKRISGVRYELRGIMAEATKKLLKTLTRRLGGRPVALKAEQHADICDEVADLYKKHVQLRIAFQRVGDRHNVSATTIKRIWQKREKESPVP
jgi:hypothetical protein